MERQRTMKATVAQGAAWLDENRPGWWEGIDLPTLDLEEGERCVLGQLDGKYRTNRRRTTNKRPTYEDAVAMGFTLGRYLPPNRWTWRGLTRTWRQAIRARKEGRV